MDIDLSEEIVQFLNESGIDDHRLGLLRLNFVTSFTNPRLYADMIAIRFPKLLNATTIPDASSVSLRLESWKALNKVLATIKCEFDTAKITKYAERKVTKDEITKNLMYLKVKMDAYEPLYMSKYMSKRTGGPSRDASFVSSIVDLEGPSAKVTATPTTIKSGSKVGVTSQSASLKPTTPMSDLKSSGMTPNRRNIIFGASVQAPQSKSATLSSSKSLQTGKATMSEEQLTAIFNSLTSKLRKSNDELKRMADDMQQESDSIDSRLTQLRVQNKDELKRCDQRIRAIHYELEDIRRIAAKETTVSGLPSAIPHSTWAG